MRVKKNLTPQQQQKQQQKDSCARVKIEIKSPSHSALPKSQSFCSDLLKAKSQLKTSQSFPEELSDCNATNGHTDAEDTYVTFVPVNKDPSTDAKDRCSRRGAGTGSKVGAGGGAVSLIQLLPPVVGSEMEACEEDGSHHETLEQDSVSTISTLSSLSTSSGNSSDRDTTILENRFTLSHAAKVNGSSRCSSVDDSTTEAERTIEESLQLIRKHVSELSGIHRPAAVASKTLPDVPPPPEFDEAAMQALQLEADAFECSSYLAPPPPEFCDTSSHLILPPMPTSMAPPIPSSTIQCRTLPKSLSSGQLRSCRDNDNYDSYDTYELDAYHLIPSTSSRRVVERRLSDDGVVQGRAAVRVVGAVPKKVSFSPDVIDAADRDSRAAACARSFCAKRVHEWTVDDTADWLDSLFLGEYKSNFVKKDVDGRCLLRLNNDMLLSLGVKRVAHRLNMEKSLKHHLQPRN